MYIHYRPLLTTSSETISPIGYNSGPRPATGPALRSDNEQSDFLLSSCHQSMPIFTCRTPPSSVLIAKIMHRLPMAVVRSSRHMHVRGAGSYLAATLLSLRLSLACICGLKNTRYSWWTWISLSAARLSTNAASETRAFAMSAQGCLYDLSPCCINIESDTAPPTWFLYKAGTIQALYKSIEYNHSA